jgi:DNA-binding FadR family transcriptional regulator|tara:strand:+ start:512 stop:925 length:414 start_codon:yes stop_codon:yes gene_type:complete
MPSSNTISHEIVDTLRDEILRQRYQSGDRFPSERDLAARLDAGRGAVREGLSKLEQLGLIRIQPGCARVQSLNLASLAVLGPLLALDDHPEPIFCGSVLANVWSIGRVNCEECCERGVTRATHPTEETSRSLKRLSR